MSHYTTVNPEPEQLMTCPYNASHQVMHHRMQYHLEKCRKQYPKSLTVTCPFDATHIINAQEKNFHILSCPKRAMIDTQRYLIDDGAEFIPSSAPAQAAGAEENWDNENYTSYKPQVNTNIINKIKGATPSERKEFRRANVQNFNKNKQM